MPAIEKPIIQQQLFLPDTNRLKKRSVSYFLVFIASTLLFLTHSPNALATHLVGGSITYKYVTIDQGLYVFQVTVDMFRDCTTPPTQPSPTPFDATISIGVYERKRDPIKGDTALLTTLVFDLQSETDVSPPAVSKGCPPPPSVCLKEGIYTGYLNVNPSNYGYYLVFTRCCRNTMVNVPDFIGQTYFAIIPPTTTLNSTPTFNAVPSPYICTGDTISLNYSATEPDGDSLSYAMAWPYSGGDANTPIPTPSDPFVTPGLVPYNSGYSYITPLGAKGFVTIDKITGLINMYAPQAGRYAIAVDVSEYRKGKLISKTRRDIQIISEPCFTQPPPKRVPIVDSISLDNSTTNTYTVEAGYRLAFNLMYTSDSSIKSFSYSGFVINPGNVTYKPVFSSAQTKYGATSYFSWQTVCKDASPVPYTFTVTVSDHDCPDQTTFDGIKIFVTPFLGATHIKGPNPACQATQSIYSTNVQKKGYVLVWNVKGGTYVKGPNDSSIKVTWTNPGTGIIKVTGYNSITGCRSDTVTELVKINPKPSPPIIIGPKTSCIYDTARYKVANYNMAAYLWKERGGPGIYFNVSHKPVGEDSLWIAPFNRTDTDYISVFGIDSNGCLTDTTTLKPIIQKAIADSIFGSLSVCPNSSGIDYWVKSQTGSTYYWSVIGGTQVAGGNTSQIKIDWGNKGGGIVKVKEITQFGCPSDTVTLKVTKDYVLYTSPIKGDTSMCEYKSGVIYSVTNSNGSTYAWTISGGTIISGNGTSSITVDWDKAGKGVLMVTESAFDGINNKPCVGIPVTVVVSIHVLPTTSEINGPTGICEKDIAIYNVNGLPGSTYLWKFHGITNISHADTARWQEVNMTALEDTINVEVTEYSKDSCPGPTRYLVVTAHKIPVTSEITGPDLICFPNLKGAIYSVTGFPTSTYQWVVDGGAIVSGDKTSQVTVDWYIVGNRSVHVQEFSDFGCAGPLKELSVKVDSLNLDMDLVTTNEANDKEIDLFWEAKNEQFFNGYFKIYRSTQGQEFYRLIDSVPKTQTYYVDKDVNTSLDAYRYKVVAVNSCGYQVSTNVHRSIKLSGAFDGDTTININWNPYEGWPVDHYNINNSSNTDTSVTIYNFTKDTTYAVIKTLEGYRLCMRIAAYKAGSNLKNVISWSNKICVDLSPIVWIPNVFTPQNGDNINNTYHVFVSNYKSYQLDIYNRWGEHIFSSDSPDKQWDGRFKGNLCIEGVYLYIVKVEGAKDNIYKNGTVNLLR